MLNWAMMNARLEFKSYGWWMEGQWKIIHIQRKKLAAEHMDTDM